jgi:hypothetical protein
LAGRPLQPEINGVHHPFREWVRKRPQLTRGRVSGLLLDNLVRCAGRYRARASSSRSPGLPPATPAIGHAIGAGTFARWFAAANCPPLLPQAGRRRGRSPAQTAMSRRQSSRVAWPEAGSFPCCDDGGRYQLLPVSAETSARSLPTRIPESIITRPGRYGFASLRDGALRLIGFLTIPSEAPRSSRNRILHHH